MSIEDDADIAEFLRAYFRASGYDLVHLDPPTAAEAVEGVAAERPDCLLLDLGLRGFGGQEAYDLLLADERFETLPVIIVTGSDRARHRGDELVRRPIDGVVAKPFNANTLAGVVAGRIAAARALVEPIAADALADHLVAGLAAARRGRKPVSFAIVRLDGRSAIGSELGPAALDYVDREAVRRLREALPDGLAFGRAEGDDLALVLPGTDPAAATTLVDELLWAAAGVVALPGGGEVHVRLVAGVAGYPAHAANADELYMAADHALADAVSSGQTIATAI
jgi:PleD family two-component response regulator